MISATGIGIRGLPTLTIQSDQIVSGGGGSVGFVGGGWGGGAMHLGGSFGRVGGGGA